MKQTQTLHLVELAHCPICTHNVPARIRATRNGVQVVPGQKCPRCNSTLDVAVVLLQPRAA